MWGLFCFFGMYLNVNLATAIIPHGTDLQGLAAGAYQAEYLSRIWAGFWFLTLFNGFWILFKTQLGNTDILVRTITDAVWMSSHRAREWRMGIRAIYYGILVVFSVWGIFVDPVGLAVPVVQNPGEHGRHRAARRRRANLPGEPTVSAEGGSSAAVARGGTAALFRVLRVLRVFRRARLAAVADVGTSQGLKVKGSKGRP